ncbi:unnamed protein product [Rhizoctonia solani]|uniref:DSBA-like thioredoxin domain-containing protein n=1 Tax=Rhizoctonia solani TaxID=456999 RepID=A0A8H3AWC7_9AGAM|nr:unnamed protein product [Rhizoctonia solani]
MSYSPTKAGQRTPCTRLFSKISKFPTEPELGTGMRDRLFPNGLGGCNCINTRDFMAIEYTANSYTTIGVQHNSLEMSEPVKVKFYFDIASPFSYIGLERLFRHEKAWNLSIELCPVGITIESRILLS